MLIDPDELKETIKVVQDFQKDPENALLDYYKKKHMKPFRVEPEEDELSINIEGSLKTSLDTLIRRLDHLNENLFLNSKNIASFDDVSLIPKPLDRVGIYVPYRLASSLITWASAAKSAGVKNITVYLARNSDDGEICMASIYAAKKYGAKIFSGPARFGFPFLALNLKKPVDMICGPSGRRLNVLKQVCALIGGKAIDFFAGPSEIAVIVSSFKYIEQAIRDLEAQIEHGKDSKGYLILVGECLEKKYKENISDNPQIEVIYVKNLNEAVDRVNVISPETIEMLGDKDIIQEFSQDISNCGVLYLNASSSLGDYMAIGRGCADPTQKTARSFGGISPFSFIRYLAKIDSKNICLDAKASGLFLARYENNHAHFAAIDN